MKALTKAILIGAVTATLTWGVAYCVLHEPNPRRMPDGSLEYIICCPGDDNDLTASFWAAGAYMLTFTPAILLLRGRTPKDVFAQRPSIG